MRGRRAASLAGIAVGYVLLSSWFGLNGTPLLQGHFEGRLDFFVDVWSDRLLADVVFVAGTIAAGLAALRLVERLHPLAGVLGGALGNWAVYLASYLLLGETQNQRIEGVWASARFVAEWGWPGLILAAVVPVAGLWWVRRRRAVDPLDGHEVRSR